MAKEREIKSTAMLTLLEVPSYSLSSIPNYPKDCRLYASDGASLNFHKMLLTEISPVLHKRLEPNDSSSSVLLPPLNSNGLQTLYDILYKGQSIIPRKKVKQIYSQLKYLKVDMVTRDIPYNKYDSDGGGARVACSENFNGERNNKIPNKGSVTTNGSNVIVSDEGIKTSKETNGVNGGNIIRKSSGTSEHSQIAVPLSKVGRRQRLSKVIESSRITSSIDDTTNNICKNVNNNNSNSNNNYDDNNNSDNKMDINDLINLDDNDSDLKASSIESLEFVNLPHISQLDYEDRLSSKNGYDNESGDNELDDGDDDDDDGLVEDEILMEDEGEAHTGAEDADLVDQDLNPDLGQDTKDIIRITRYIRKILPRASTFQTAPDSFECFICFKSLCNSAVWANHLMAQHYYQNFTCPQCGKKFNYFNVFNQHLYKFHGYRTHNPFKESPGRRKTSAKNE